MVEEEDRQQHDRAPLFQKGIQTPMAQRRSTEIISMIKWIQTSRLSKKNSLSLDSSMIAPPCSKSGRDHFKAYLDGLLFDGLWFMDYGLWIMGLWFTVYGWFWGVEC